MNISTKTPESSRQRNWIFSVKYSEIVRDQSDLAVIRSFKPRLMKSALEKIDKDSPLYNLTFETHDLTICFDEDATLCEIRSEMTFHCNAIKQEVVRISEHLTAAENWRKLTSKK